MVQLCSGYNKCYPICDFCQHYDFNAKEYPDGTMVYVYKGHCNKHDKRSDPDDGCDDFVCFNLKGVD